MGKKSIITSIDVGTTKICTTIAEYNDNEMVREVSTEFSGNFLIKSKPKISFELTSATMNSVDGVLSLIDANCTVPMNGRICDGRANNFTLRYYKMTEDEHNGNDSVYFGTKTTEGAVSTLYGGQVFKDRIVLLGDESIEEMLKSSLNQQ